MQSIIVNNDEKYFTPLPGPHKPVSGINWDYIGMRRTYGVKMWWNISGKEHSLQQQVRLSCIQRGDDNVLWAIAKQQFFIDGHVSENPMVELVIACSNVLYPVQFTKASNSSVDMYSIENAAAIKQKFINSKPILERDFKGTITKKYLDDMEAALQQKEGLTKIIEQDVWLSLFFNHLFGRYEDHEREQSISIPFWGVNDQVHFKGISQVNKTVTAWQTISLTYKGVLDIETLSPEVKYIYQPTAGNISISYDLEEDTHRIQNIVCDITIQTVNKGDATLKITGYKLTEQDEKDVPPIIIRKEKPWKWYTIFDI